MESARRIQFAQVQKSEAWLDFIVRHFAVSKDTAENLAALGAIYRNQSRWSSDDVPVFQAQDVIRVHLQPKRFPVGLLRDIEILVDEPTWFAVRKPRGLPSHETLDNLHENVKAEMQRRLGQEVWGLSRLDVGTSGVLLFAKNSQTARDFNTKVLPQAEKIYSARVWLHSNLELGRFTHWMKKDKRAPKILSEEKSEEFSLRCDLEILTISKNSIDQVLKIRLITGRTHQIRAQLSKLGAPILGDTLYGGRDDARFTRAPEAFGLHCDSVSFFYEGREFEVHSSRDMSSSAAARIQSR